eukprot:538702-Hanusia_phi.AAC.1
MIIRRAAPRLRQLRTCSGYSGSGFRRQGPSSSSLSSTRRTLRGSVISAAAATSRSPPASHVPRCASDRTVRLVHRGNSVRSLRQSGPGHMRHCMLRLRWIVHEQELIDDHRKSTSTSRLHLRQRGTTPRSTTRTTIRAT